MDILNIALVGMPAAGKSTVAKTLEEKFGFNWIRTRDIVREFSTSNTIESLQTKGVDISQGAASISFCKILLDKIHDSKPNVIDSLRPINHLEFLKGNLNLVTVAISAPKNIRQNRLTQREGTGHVLESRDQHKVESEVPDLIEMADYHLRNISHLDLRIELMHSFLLKLKITK